MKIFLIVKYLSRLHNPDACAYIRLIYPARFFAKTKNINIQFGSLENALLSNPDIIVYQRIILGNYKNIYRLEYHAKKNNIRLIYDLDDDLLNLSERHPEKEAYDSKASVVKESLRIADQVVVSTDKLRQSYKKYSNNIVIWGNRLEPSLWIASTRQNGLNNIIRILYMGGGSHRADFEIILRALTKLKRCYTKHIEIDIACPVVELSPYWTLLDIPAEAAGSYPAFVNWIQKRGRYDIGLAPLEANEFNQGKSGLKVLEYAALGAVTIASDLGEYPKMEMSGAPVTCVGNTTHEWFEILSKVVENSENIRNDLQDKRSYWIRNNCWLDKKSLPPWPECYVTSEKDTNLFYGVHYKLWAIFRLTCSNIIYLFKFLARHST